VKGYYESIDHTILLKQLNKDITNPFIWRLLVQFVKRSVERDGTFKSITCGISRGCSLSPVIAAYYLTALDEQIAADTRYFYRRYIHEWPYLVGGNKTPLAKGMCFSNEPMLVVPDEFGIRLEDYFYMADKGARWFTEPSNSIDNPFGLSN
jgi:hypothetical protein